MNRRRSTATILIVLLLPTILVGCIGGEDTESTDVEPQADTNTTRSSGCSTNAVDGQLTPTRSLSVTSDAGADGASAHIAMDAQGAGASGIHVTLERDGEEVWSNDAGSGIAATNWRNSAQPLAAGEYTLTASTGDGAYDIQELRLQITWGGGSCS